MSRSSQPGSDDQQAEPRPGQPITTGTQRQNVPGQRPAVPEAEPPAQPDEAEDEVRRLQGELDQARGQLATRERRQHRWLVTRRLVAAVLVVVAAFGTAASVVGVWAARTTLNTDRWVATVEPLPANPDVANAVSIYLTDEVFRVLDVRQRVAEVLPPQAAFVAVPLTNSVRDYVQRTVDDVIQSPQFQQLWITLQRRAHTRILALVEGDNPNVQVAGDKVTLNLLPIFNNVLTLLEQRAPTIFGKQLNLPTINNGEVPPGLQTRIESALGVTLPDNFSRVTIYKAKELSAVQDSVAAFKKYVVLLVVVTLLALALALWASPWRRRTILQYGVWLAIAVLVVATVLRRVRDQILSEVPAGAFREGAAAASKIIFTTLRERADQLIWLGVAIAVVAYLVGPGKLPVWLRGSVVRAARASWSWTRGLVAGQDSATWVRDHLDAMRIGGVVVAGVLALILSSWTSLFVLLVLLGAYELAVTLVAAERPRQGVSEEVGAGGSAG